MTQKPLKGFALMILGLTSFHKWVIIFLCYFWFHFRQTLLCIYIKYHENIQTSMFWPQTKDIWLIGVCATQPLVCKGKPQVSMTTLCSTAVPTAVLVLVAADSLSKKIRSRGSMDHIWISESWIQEVFVDRLNKQILITPLQTFITQLALVGMPQNPC